jgi:hypothetical protein
MAIVDQGRNKWLSQEVWDLAAGPWLGSEWAVNLIDFVGVQHDSTRDARIMGASSTNIDNRD